MSKFTNAYLLEQIGNALFGERWKTEMAVALDLTPRTMRLYDSMRQSVPDKVIVRAKTLAQARAERLSKLASIPVPEVVEKPARKRSAKAAEPRFGWRPIDVEALLAEADAAAAQRPTGTNLVSWMAKQEKREIRVKPRDGEVEMRLAGVGGYRMTVHVGGGKGAFDDFDIRKPAGQAAIGWLDEWTRVG